MRRPAPRLLALAGLALTLAAGPLATLSTAADSPFDGRWKLVVQAFGGDEFAIVDIKSDGKEPTAKVVDAATVLGGIKTAEVATSGDAVVLVLGGGRLDGTFLGSMAKGGDAPRVGGVYKIQSTTYPAILEKTDAAKVGEMKQPDWQAAYVSAARESDPKARVEKLGELLEKYPGKTFTSNFYEPLLRSASAAGLSADQVKERVNQWIKQSQANGDAWTAEVESRAIKALTTDKAAPYKDLVADLKARRDKLSAQVDKTFGPPSLRLAEAADQALDKDATAEVRAKSASRLLAAAKMAGNAAVVAETERRIVKIDADLDAEYKKTTPGFKVEEFAGRKDPKADRVVVFELFTGAQCPPCVGADIGYDAILEAYQPTEVIGLQYHLHIPGPDPMTNPTTIARQGYYGAEIQGTPSTFFNGKRAGGSGGFRQHSEKKFGEYRDVIDPLLKEQKQATIDLAAQRAGDEIKVQAKADAGGHAKKPRLRLVLVEETVRYVGGNGLRFHHHVVRAMPGGPEGIELKDGKGEFNETIKLADVRKAITTYVEEFGSFPNTPPPLDFDHLALVALVQDDDGHEILHAAWAPLDGKKGEPQP